MTNTETRKTSFSRRTLRVAGSLILLIIIETQLTQFLRVPGKDWEVFYTFSAIFLLLPVPAVAFVVIPVIDMMNRAANKRPVFLVISKNKITGQRLDAPDRVHEVTASFSEGHDLVAHYEPLREAARSVIFKCMEDVGKVSPSPYVVITAESNLSPIIANAVRSAVTEAGAVKAEYIGPKCSHLEASRFVAQFPLSENLA